MDYNITYIAFAALSIECAKLSHFVCLIFKRITTFGIKVVCGQLLFITKPEMIDVKMSQRPLCIR